MGLILTRRVGQRVRMTIPPSAQAQVIEVLYLEQRGQKSRFKFDADPAVKIVRTELDGGDNGDEQSETAPVAERDGNAVQVRRNVPATVRRG